MMIRQLSHGSSSNNSTAAASPKIKSFWQGRKKNRSSMSSSSPSQDSPGGLMSDKIFLRNHSEDPIVNSPLALPELEPARSNGLPSPDPYFASTHDSEYMHLKEYIRKLRKAPPGTEPKKVDAQWEVYKKVRDECLQLCKSLLEKSHSNGRNTSLESSLDPIDARSSYSGSLMENPTNLHPNDQRIAAIQEYKAIQEQILDNFRNSLLATYTKNEPDPSERQKITFLDDVTFRKGLIVKWRDNSIHAMRSEKLLFWEQFKIRSLNFERLKTDLKAISQVIDTPEPSFDNQVADTNIQEYVIAKNGDAILEFGNKGWEGYPMLRFRVSSQLLAESSPLFAQMLLPQQPGTIPPADMENQLSEPPGRHVCKDGMEVKVYRMPQIELNCHDALTILLHAAHMHNAKVPRQIEFPVFVSIAEVCLRYRCTSPLELLVEYQWLPQWIHMASGDSPDGLLLISFAFGLRRIFTRMSKTAILNAVDEDEIQSKEIWPQAIKDKIKAIRAAKLAQIHECCTKAIEEYFRPPSTTIDRRTSVGSLQLTTSPRCPKGQHLCDATNLGWLMLVYNELRVLPSLMNKVGFQNLPESPRRSLKGLLDCLRLMPSAPQVHEGVCDYAPAFRSTIDDIYNSISGLTLKDVTGKDGWALSKHAGPDEQSDDKLQEIIELPGSIFGLPTSGPTTSGQGFNNQSISNEEISLLSQSLEDSESDDIIEEHRGRPGSHGSSYFPGPSNGARAPPKISIPTDKEEKALAAEKLALRSAPHDGEPEDDIYTASPLAATINHRLEEVQMSDEEAHRILWPDEEYISPILVSPTRSIGRAPPEENEKVLLDDIQRAGGKPRAGTGDTLDAPLEGKARIGDSVEEKNLRAVKDLAMGLGPYKQNPPLP